LKLFTRSISSPIFSFDAIFFFAAIFSFEVISSSEDRLSRPKNARLRIKENPASGRGVFSWRRLGI
jgi:hypothetical protein